MAKIEQEAQSNVAKLKCAIPPRSRAAAAAPMRNFLTS